MRRFPMTLPLLLAAACGGDDDVEFPIDAQLDSPVIVDAPIDGILVDAPVGPDFTYVVSAYNIPANASEAQMLGLDIDNKPNDGIDNQLGMVFGSLDALNPGFSAQTATDLAIAQGDIIWLAHAAGMIEGGTLALATHGGTNPNPPPCEGPGDTVCGRHLAGTGTFTLDESHASAAPIVGTVSLNPNPRFLGEGGRVVLPLGFASGVAWLPLERAKADLTTLDTGVLSGKLGGAIAMDDIHSELIPAVAEGARASFDVACDVGGVPPTCGCTPGSTSETMRGVFDRTPADCFITDAEVDSVFSGFLTPDIDTNGDAVNDAISIGVGITAVPGQFTPPP